jgi:hypothetical protein
VDSVPGGRRGDGASVAGAGDRVASAASELYGADPQEFTDRRKALATAARDAGDAEAAKRIAALRKPTRAAWVVNSLARADPGAAGRLAALAASLRAAEQAKDGRRLRELSAERGSLIDSLTSQALAAAGVADAPAGLREEVTATLTAALADQEVAASLAAGTLTKAAQWAGFGFGLPEVPAADAARAAARGTAATAEVTGLDEARRRKERRAQEGRTARQRQAEEADGTGRHAQEGRTARQAEADSRRQAEDESRRQRQAEEERRLAGEAAQATARRRQIFEDAERGVASAASAAMDAVAAEDRLEREVRDLEERLTRVRAELADARVRARRAEAAERKTRQTLARLPRPDE